MYDPILAKSFSRYERKKFGWCALILSLIMALSLCSTFKPHLHPLSLIGEAVNLQLSINAVQDMLASANETTENSKPTVDNRATNLQLSIKAAENIHLVNDTTVISKPSVDNRATNLQLLIKAAENIHLINDTTVISKPSEKKMIEPLCRILNSKAYYCDIEGDIRIQANSSTIFVVAPHERIQNLTNSWSIQPYPRKGMSNVKHWTVKPVEYEDEDGKIPKCTQNHSIPAILFSTGGYSGNHFHDFADLLFPLYSTSFSFKGDVHFLASDYKPWWVGKYRGILNRLTRNEIVDIDKEQIQVHCYKNLVAGLKFHKELILDQSETEYSTRPSMSNFRHLLRQTYALERKKAIKSRKGDGRPPRLIIISRKRTRILTNEVEVSRVARKLGFDVVLAEANLSTNLSRFAQEVNSCDVLMGIHGAGLANMVFLPENSVLIQVVPFGGLDGYARLDFGNPSAGMNIRYLEYKITMKESSLSRQYPSNHRVLKDPMYFHRKGWETMKSIYLNDQNVTIDVGRLKGTLVKALKILRH